MGALPGAQELKKFKAKRLYVKQLYSGNQAAIKAGVDAKNHWQVDKRRQLD